MDRICLKLATFEEFATAVVQVMLALYVIYD